MRTHRKIKKCLIISAWLCQQKSWRAPSSRFWFFLSKLLLNLLLSGPHKGLFCILEMFTLQFFAFSPEFSPLWEKTKTGIVSKMSDPGAKRGWNLDHWGRYSVYTGYVWQLNVQGHSEITLCFSSRILDNLVYRKQLVAERNGWKFDSQG